MADVTPIDRRSAQDKARLVINALAAAALPLPFGFDEDTVVELWAGLIGTFTVADLTAAVGQWVMNESKYPTVEQFLRIVQRVSYDRVKAARPLDEECPECEGVRYVRIVDETIQVETWASKKLHRKRDGTDDGSEENREFVDVELHHYQPCSLCIPDRFDLYMRGHWDAGHLPCPTCRPYREPGRKGKVLARH